MSWKPHQSDWRGFRHGDFQSARVGSARVRELYAEAGPKVEGRRSNGKDFAAARGWQRPQPVGRSWVRNPTGPEGSSLGRFKEAIVRLTTAAARCRKANLPEAAQILDALRQDYLTRREG